MTDSTTILEEMEQALADKEAQRGERGIEAQPKGMRLIAQELKVKGIDARDLNLDEDVLARHAVEKKLLLWQKLPKLEQKKKIYGFLGRRGFSYTTIASVIDEMLEKGYNTKEVE